MRPVCYLQSVCFSKQYPATRSTQAKQCRGPSRPTRLSGRVVLGAVWLETDCVVVPPVALSAGWMLFSEDTVSCP